MDKHVYVKLDTNDIPTITGFEPVFITLNTPAFKLQHAPAMLFLNESGDDITLMIPQTAASVLTINHALTKPEIRHIEWPLNQCPTLTDKTCPPDSLTIERRVSILTETPDGTLRAWVKQDDEYPGIWTELVDDNGKDLTMGLTEYISGGEGTCDFDPPHLMEMRRQNDEVPSQRRRPRANSKMANWWDKDEVTPGLVTRAWPDERHNEDKHFRTFHYGYKSDENGDDGHAV